MKKLFLMAIAALAMTFTACGNKNGAKADAEGEAEGEKEGFVVYTNDTYAFTVEVPAWMKRVDPQYNPESGTTYMSNPDDMFDINRVSIYGDNDGYVYDPWTPENVKKRFDSTIEDMNNVTDQELKDMEFTITRKSDGHTTIEYNKFKDMKQVTITIDFDDDKADKLGGDVAKHIMESVTVE